MAELSMRLLVALCLAASLLHAEDKPKFRTDADGPVQAGEKRTNPKDRNPGDKPDWFQLVEGQFRLRAPRTPSRVNSSMSITWNVDSR